MDWLVSGFSKLHICYEEVSRCGEFWEIFILFHVQSIFRRLFPLSLYKSSKWHNCHLNQAIWSSGPITICRSAKFCSAFPDYTFSHFPPIWFRNSSLPFFTSTTKYTLIFVGRAATWRFSFGSAKSLTASRFRQWLFYFLAMSSML